MTAVARVGSSEWRFQGGLWKPPVGVGVARATLRSFGAVAGLPVVITADLPEHMQAGGSARQPLLWVADGASGPAAHGERDAHLHRLRGLRGAGRAGARERHALRGCSAAFDAGDVDITLAPTPSPAGTYVVQLLNPEGFASNELPVVTQ